MPSYRHSGRHARGGFLILLTLVACAVLVFLLDDLKQRAQNTYDVIAVFPKAPRLQAGAPVWLAGHPVGRVKDVEFLAPSADSSKRLAARLEVLERVRPQIRRDSNVRLISQRLIGDPAVDITPGTSATPVLAENDTLRAAFAPDFGDVKARFAAFRVAFDSLQLSAHALDTTLRAAQPRIERTQREILLARSEFKRLAHQLEHSPFAAWLADDESRRALAELGSSLSDAVAALQRRVTQHAAPDALLRRSFERLGVRARELGDTIARLDSLSRNGFFRRASQDSALALTLRQTRADLDSLIAEAKRKPLRFLY